MDYGEDYDGEDKQQMFNTGMDITTRINWAQWQINEALRIPDFREALTQMGILMTELSQECREKDIKPHLNKYEELSADIENYYKHTHNHSLHPQYTSPPPPLHLIRSKLFIWYTELKRLLKDTGMGMPKSSEWGDAI